MCKGMMKPSDLVIVDLEGRRVSGRRDVSSEIAMHLLIYKLRPDIRGLFTRFRRRPPDLLPPAWP